mmetsp:Transcript_7211/g.20323  ORF Transcript_7211/g.20323 Transcript_7211/m.20323 type:complete len:204 (+) Transcript_7211:673-1284(+)
MTGDAMPWGPGQTRGHRGAVGLESLGGLRVGTRTQGAVGFEATIQGPVPAMCLEVDATGVAHDETCIAVLSPKGRVRSATVGTVHICPCNRWALGAVVATALLCRNVQRDIGELRQNVRSEAHQNRSSFLHIQGVGGKRKGFQQIVHKIPTLLLVDEGLWSWRACPAGFAIDVPFLWGFVSVNDSLPWPSAAAHQCCSRLFLL